MLTGFAPGAERVDSLKVGSAVRDSSEVRSIGGDSPEMGLTNLAKVEGRIGKRLGRGSS